MHLCFLVFAKVLLCSLSNHTFIYCAIHFNLCKKQKRRLQISREIRYHWDALEFAVFGGKSHETKFISPVCARTNANMWNIVQWLDGYCADNARVFTTFK